MTYVYETPSMRWQPWICVSVVVAVLVIAASRGASTTLTSHYWLLPIVAVGGAAACLSGFTVAWRLELSDTDLIVRFPWRPAVTIPLAQVAAVRSKKRFRMEDGSSQWAYLTTTSGRRFSLWVPRRKRRALQEFRDELVPSS